MSEQQFCTFSLADDLFGVPVICVQEVLRYQAMTPVPLAEEEIRGLLNLRGQLVTAICLRKRLGMATRDDGTPPMNVVVHSGEHHISLLVDRIGDVLTLGDDQREDPPEHLPQELHRFCVATYKLEDRLLLILDAPALARVGGAAAA